MNFLTYKSGYHRNKKAKVKKYSILPVGNACKDGASEQEEELKRNDDNPKQGFMYN